MINEKTPYILYGGDYNPDQWTSDIIEQDMEFFKKANINVVTLPVFSWALLQPSEETYDFQWLDNILDILLKNNINVCMATSTASQPTWMSKKYPEMLPTNFHGVKMKHGGRVQFCPSNETYKKYSVKLATKLAERYKDYPNLIAWHIGNEYNNYCYCDHCQEEFRKWVKNKYKTIENVNKVWNMNFWGHTLYSFDEIYAPSTLTEMWESSGKTWTTFQSIALDYNRFMSESILECYLGEYNAIKAITPNIKITTNLMGTFKPLDYFRWAEHMDIVSWDNYPSFKDSPSATSLRHDLMRGLKNGEPFMLMEQTPNQTNWQPYNTVKRPGVMRLQSYQAMAHGADTVMFFQMRQSIGCCEKYHSAVIPHSNNPNTRVFKECCALGEELKALGDKILDSKIISKVAIIFDWENWWAMEFSSGPSIELNYLNQIEKFYDSFNIKNIAIDFVQPTSDLSKYSIVIAPTLYMLKDGAADNINSYVKNGGTFITTFFSGYVNENDLVQMGGYPAELREMLGLWVEEIDALTPDMSNSLDILSPLNHFKDKYSCRSICDIINLETAKPLGVYGDDFYKGNPAFTVNKYGKGNAYYIATDLENEFLNDFVDYLSDIYGLECEIKAPSGVEITERVKYREKFIFLLNHNDYEVNIELNKKYFNLFSNEESDLVLKLDKKDVVILEDVKK